MFSGNNPAKAPLCKQRLLSSLRREQCSKFLSIFSRSGVFRQNRLQAAFRTAAQTPDPWLLECQLTSSKHGNLAPAANAHFPPFCCKSPFLDWLWKFLAAPAPIMIFGEGVGQNPYQDLCARLSFALAIFEPVAPSNAYLADKSACSNFDLSTASALNGPPLLSALRSGQRTKRTFCVTRRICKPLAAGLRIPWPNNHGRPKPLDRCR